MKADLAMFAVFLVILMGLAAYCLIHRRDRP